MRIWHLILSGLIFFSGCGRLIKVPEQKRAITQVYPIQLSKDEIYDRALEWCAKRYISADNAIVVRDKEKGKIICRGTAQYSEYFNFLVDRPFGYSLTIEVKDNKYRVSFDSFIVYYSERDLKSGPAEYEFEISKIKRILAKVAESLRDYISSGVSEKEKKTEEEW
ncbi:MAG: hypothetical protein A2W19_16745 [Spirochaetes bacterium RBG_16_49_21]|nr:MAG: hypothetical protein A2W19_16745 [Spirochaetes bacterium RBG_16_49_21]